MGFIDNVPVIVGVIFPVYLLLPLNNVAHWQIAADPKTRVSLLIHRRKHDTKNMIFYMVPCFFTLPFEFVYVPANTKVIHKSRPEKETAQNVHHVMLRILAVLRCRR